MREREIFLTALDYDHPDARMEYLNRACGADSNLRDRVVALLKADAVSEGFLQIPVDISSTAIVPAQVGPFTLGELVGRGGMGAVYRAWDARLIRYVAIKLLQGLAAADPGAVTRFRYEARVTARLQHPGVPPVHEVGELPDGRPYLAMKLVEGRTLADLLRTRSNLVADRGRFVAVFEQVCQTVAFAHAQGVIHRDLKPANIMVGAFSEVQVMDWGLAKVLAESDVSSVNPHSERPSVEATNGTETFAFWTSSDQTPIAGESDATRAGAVLGTPGHMAPEQARGESVDCRADVFGLGAVLCEILTGSPPFTRETTADTLRLNAAGDTSEARDRLARCGADPELVALCEQCLTANPADRPLDAGVVAASVAEWRGRAEERARQAELDRAAAATRVREEQKRRRMAQWAAAIVGIVLLLGVTGTGWGLLGERAARQQAVTQRDQATAARDRAMSALDTVTSSAAGRSLSSQVALSPEQKAFLTNVVNEYRALATEQGDDEDTRRRVANALLRIATIEHRLGRASEAEPTYRQAVAAAEQLATTTTTDRSRYRTMVAQALGNLAALLIETGRPTDAEPELQASLAIWGELVEGASGSAVHRMGRAKGRIVLGNLYSELDRAAEAEVAYRAADTDLLRLTTDAPEVTEYRALRGNAASNLSDLLLNVPKRAAEAEAIASEAIALLQQAVTEEPAEPEYRDWLTRASSQRAAALFGLGRTAEAVESQRAAVAGWERLMVDFPSVIRYRERLCKGLTGLGRTLALTGQEAEAEASFRAAVVVAERLAADQPTVDSHRSELAGCRQSLGQILLQLKRPNDAEPVLRSAVALCDELAAKSTSSERWARTARAYGTLSQCLETIGRVSEAETASKSAVAAAEQALAAGPHDRGNASLLAAIQGNHGALLLRTGKPVDALSWFTRSADILSPLHTQNPAAPAVRLYLRNAYGRRAETLGKLGRHADALPDLDRAIELSVPREQPVFRAARALTRAHVGRTVDAVSEAAKVASDPNCGADVLFDLCRAYAVAAAADPTRTNEYGEQAVLLLRRAKEKSKTEVDLSGLTSDADLASLQSREDFRRLLGLAELAPPPRPTPMSSIPRP